MNDFQTKGYVLIKNAIDSDEIFRLEQEYRMLMEEALWILNENQKNNIPLSDFYHQEPGKLIVVPEISDSTKVCRIEYIVPRSEYIRNHLLKKILKMIHELVNEPFVLFKDKCNLKSPGGGAFPPHQDIAAYRHFKPNYHITAAVNLDDANIENGCLEFIENFQKYQFNKIENVRYVSTKFGKFPLFNYYDGGHQNGDIKSDICQAFDWFPIESQKGDVLLFHSYLPHRSQMNSSFKQRRIFYFTCNPLSEGDWYQQYYERKRQQFDNPIFHMSTPTEHTSRK